MGHNDPHYASWFPDPASEVSPARQGMAGPRDYSIGHFIFYALSQGNAALPNRQIVQRLLHPNEDEFTDPNFPPDDRALVGAYKSQ